MRDVDVHIGNVTVVNFSFLNSASSIGRMIGKLARKIFKI